MTEASGRPPVRGYEDVTPAILAAWGFADPERAARVVRALAGDGVPDALFERLLAPLLDALAASADPDRAATNFGRWAERLHARRSHFEFLAAHPPAVRALAAVFAGSQYFSNVLIGQPEYAEAVTNVRLRGAPGAKSFEAFFRDAGRAVDVFAGPGGKRAALRRFKALEMLRIGARDLTGAADTATITREISHFADAAVQKAYEFCAREACDKHGLAATPPFAVIAMGKLGGGELNYSSDIDLLFVHGDEPPGVVPADYHQGVARSLVAALSEATADGFVFRVDMRLRPEGRFGPLSRSLGSCRAYYESWAEPWERQALLKARPVAGDPALGAAFLRVVQPFVWARGGGGGGAAAGDIVAALRENKRRIETRMQMAGTWRTSVKEGYGGIRDVEWTVQALQLALGGAHPVLRNARGTAAALRGLAQLGILSEEDRQTLEEGYWFLRAVEHRLQILDELPVRDLPARPEERRRLARRLGFATVDAFDARYREVTEAVRARYERLVGGETAAPAPGAPDGAPGVGGGPVAWADLLALSDDPAARARALEGLRTCGFVDPERALRLLRIPVLGTEQGGATPGTRERFARIADALVVSCARTADPDAALGGIEALAQASPSREALYAAWADGGASWMARLCLLAAGAPPLVQTLAQHLELLDMLFDDDEMKAPATRDMLTGRVRERLRAAKSETATLRALGAFWRRERLRIAARDLWGETIDVEMTGRELTDLAEAMLAGLLDVAAHRAGVPDVLDHVAVIGLGKFGGRELNFPSDGDLLYVHDHPERAAAAEKLADSIREVMHALRTQHGVDMEFDPRLRPDGRFGRLSRTPEEYAAYYGSAAAATWEKQTLLKARPVGGNGAATAEAYLAVARGIVYEAPPTPAQVEEMRAMKRRIEAERVRPADLRADFKLGWGAMSDIEWIAQLLQWLHGHDHPAVRVPGTRAVLEALAHASLLRRDDFLTLAENYDFLARLRNAGYLRTGLPADRLPDPRQDERLRPLARLIGFTDDASGTASEHLLADYRARTDAVRAVFRRLFHGEATP